MLTFLFAVMAIILIVGVGIWAVFIVSAVLFVLFILCAIADGARMKIILETQPSEQICPMCGCTKIKFKYITQGRSSSSSTTRNSYAHGRVRAGRGYGHRISTSSTNSGSQIQHRNMAYCSECGYTFDLITQADIDAEYNEVAHNQVVCVMCAILFGIVLIGLCFFIFH